MAIIRYTSEDFAIIKNKVFTHSKEFQKLIFPNMFYGQSGFEGFNQLTTLFHKSLISHQF